MFLSLCGTPGVGKTSVAAGLRDHGYEILSERELIEEMRLFEELDTETDELIVDPAVVREGFACIMDKLSGDVVLDGHLSYLAPSDITIVLRVHPEVLGKRLEERNYPRSKIRDNMEAEALAYLLIRASEEEELAIDDDWTALREGGRTVLERDVTSMDPDEIAGWILEMVSAWKEKRLNPLLYYRPGKVDWLEECAEWF